jgi:hypothetical protein
MEPPSAETRWDKGVVRLKDIVAYVEAYGRSRTTSNLTNE